MEDKYIIGSLEEVLDEFRSSGKRRQNVQTEAILDFEETKIRDVFGKAFCMAAFSDFNHWHARAMDPYTRVDGVYVRKDIFWATSHNKGAYEALKDASSSQYPVTIQGVLSYRKRGFLLSVREYEAEGVRTPGFKNFSVDE